MMATKFESPQNLSKIGPIFSEILDNIFNFFPRLLKFIKKIKNIYNISDSLHILFSIKNLPKHLKIFFFFNF